MNGGIGRKSIFKTDQQRQYFLSLMADTSKRYSADWHAYCLMSKHYHLLLRTPEGNLQRIMRHINGVYTQYYNRSERHDGALFRGRYKVVLVDADSYWLPLSRYVHRNPLEAKLVVQLAHYRWSSYPCYIGKRQCPEWLCTDYVLQAIGQRNVHVRYKTYVAQGVDSELQQFYRSTYMRPILGDQEFREQVHSGRQRQNDPPELRQALQRPSLDAIVQATAQYYRVDETSLWQSRRGRAVQTPARSVAMYLCQIIGDMRLSAIAEAFNLSSYASAGATIRTVKQRISGDSAFSDDIDIILLDLTP